MRTTVDLSPELFQAAKIAAASRGVSLKDLFTKALTREIGANAPIRSGRVAFPLVGGLGDGPLRDITNADIAEVLDADDIEKYSR